MALKSLKTLCCTNVTLRKPSAVLLFVSALDQMLILRLACWWEKSQIGQEQVSPCPGESDALIRQPQTLGTDDPEGQKGA